MDRVKLWLVAAVATVVSTTGCYKATFVDNPASAQRTPTHEEWTDHYMFGLVGDEDYDVRQWCPDGAGVVRTGGNAGTAMATIFTLGIYAPRKIYVTCEEPAQVSTSEVAQ